jgi:hypothetical protein
MSYNEKHIGVNQKLVIDSGGTLNINDGGSVAVKSGGTLDIESGGYLKIAGATIGSTLASGTQAANIVDAKTDYEAGDLDTEGEIIIALNLTNTKLNAVIAALEAFKITAAA